MNCETLKTHLNRFSNLKIGVLGDFCLDAYWLLDQTNVEFSVETGKPTNAICKQSYSLGGAGNVISNLLALGIGEVHALGVIGDDVFGREMIDLLRRGNVNTTGMTIQKENWDTCVYAKPYVDLDEKERIDFGRFNKLADATADRLLAGLEQTLDSLDGLIVNQQIRSGIHSDHLIAGLQKIIDQHPDKIILLDARDVCDRYRNLIFKLNAGEAARVCGQTREIHQAVSPEELSLYAKEIFGRTARPVVITRGDRGILAYDGQAFSQIPGILCVGPIDTVGAGDTTASAVTAALAAGAKLAEAIEIGNYAAAVIVRKLRQTGTATPEEILSIAAECDYVYQPELAEDIRKRSFRKDTEIEIVGRDFQWGEIHHVIFDHDGTISTLRQGWEAIMEPVMVRAILGPHYLDAPEELYQRIIHRVREYIDQSTGIETIVQMRSLADMVRQFGQVPPDQILDAAGYKKIYNDALMEMVRRRTDKLGKKELDTADYTIKGAPEFLKSLHDRGIKLYLASGTDHNDIVHEAKSLGYADLFEGRIYGWGGKGEGSAKKMVIEQILRENNLSGRQLACIGDGPVELRLCKKVGGLAIGIASDEVRRYDLNLTKRTRLIKSGADILIPDYSQRSALIALICAQ
jgi:rfaE bifunctional protein kinase chain/domain